MASTKVRGITIELGADTSGISSALKGVNSEIKSTSTQLKDVERLLKLDPTNTELLAQKQRLLADKVGETKTKLVTLKKAQEEVGKTLKETGEGQKEYDALTREISACETELKAAEKEARNFNVTAAKISATADSMAKGLSTAATKTRALSMAAGGLIVAAGGAAVKAAQSADELNTLAKQSGFTTAELQKMQYAAERVDVPMETIVASARKMEKQLGSSEQKFTDLGVATRNADGTFRSVNDIFFDTVDALSKVDDETQRDILSQDIFGKSANELAGIIDDGAASLKAYGEEAENMDLIIPQDQLDKANELNDAIDKVKSESAGAFAQIGTEIAEELLPYIPDIVKGIEDVLKFIKQLDPNVVKTVAAVVAAIAVISPLLSAMSGVCTGISAVSSAISFLLANPIVLLIAAIIALTALIAVKGDEIQATFQKIDDFVQNVFSKDWTQTMGALGEPINMFMATLRNQWNSMKSIFNGIIDFVRGVFTGDWDRAWKGVKEIFAGYFGMFVNLAKVPLNGVILLINGVIGAINKFADWINGFDIDIPEGVPFVGGTHFSPNVPTIGKIPYLAKGGILSQGSAIVGEAGAELLTMVNGRAVVQPLTTNNNSYAGNTNNFYIQSNDPYAVAEQVSEILDHRTNQIREAWA